MLTIDKKNGKKIRVAVLYGGRSGEHEVSLRSATNVIQNLDRNRFEVVPIGIDKHGSWYLGDDSLKLLENEDATLQLTQNDERMLFTPSFINQHPQIRQATDLLSVNKKTDRLFDVIFPVIHGTLCEDGTVQGLLELAEVPYVGCGVLSSAIGMDKDVSKRLIDGAGLHVPPYLVVKLSQWEQHPKEFCEKVSEKLTYPVFVKPANTGSSVGVKKVKDKKYLQDAINKAFLYDTKVLVEQGIDAREIELSVLESLEFGQEPIVSVPGEIQPQNGHEFYSYASKYLDENGAALVIPAEMDNDLQQRLTTVAKIIFAALECEGMARVDLLLEKNTNRIFFNEINTIPGFTQISMYPKLLMASGMTYTNLLSHLVDLAIDRHARKAKLCREYVA